MQFAGHDHIAECSVEYGFKNHGRTPAIVNRMKVANIAFVQVFRIEKILMVSPHP